jgi:hypothetical protein
VVYEAEDLKLGRHVDLKFLPDASDTQHKDACPTIHAATADGLTFVTLPQSHPSLEYLSARERHESASIPTGEPEEPRGDSD